MATVQVGGSDIAYSEEGEGPPVVLLHGGGSNRRQWKPLAALLADRYRVLAPDLHGHGESAPWSQATAPALADFGAIVPAVTAGIDGRPHVVGHSGGGAFALADALRRPGAIASLVLVEPTLSHVLRLAGRDAAWREINEIGMRHHALIERGEVEACADVFLPYWIGQAAWDATPPERRAAIVATMPTVAHFWRATFAETAPLDAYAAVTVPVLLMRGARTSRASHEIVDLLAATLPDATLVEIEDAGHMSPLTHPDEVNAAIAGFLDGMAHG